MTWTQSGNIKGASGIPGASGPVGATGPAGPTGATGASGGTGGTGGPGTTTWADIVDKPGAILNYKGTWNASSNSPTLSDATGSGGDVYRVSVGASRNLGSGTIAWDVGDYAIWSPVTSSWEKADTTDAVSSVAGRTGAVTLTSADLGASGTASSSTFLRGDNTWATTTGITRSISTVTSSTTLASTANTDYVCFSNIAATGGDANYSSVSLLLHGAGANNSMTMTDSSSSPKTITANGNTKISTTDSKFGGSSIFFDGTGDYLSIPTNTGFVFGTGDFCVETFVNVSSSGSGDDGCIFECRGGSGGFVFNLRAASGGFRLNFFDGGANVAATTLALNTWHHIAITRSGSTVRLFANGTVDLTVTNSNNFASTPTINIGQSTQYGGSNITGYLDEYRVTKGQPRYTANFTPTTSAFPEGPVPGSITLPTATGGTTNAYSISNIHSTDSVQLATTSSQTINGSTPGTLAAGSRLTVVSDGSNWRSPW